MGVVSVVHFAIFRVTSVSGADVARANLGLLAIAILRALATAWTQGLWLSALAPSARNTLRGVTPGAGLLVGACPTIATRTPTVKRLLKAL